MASADRFVDLKLNRDLLDPNFDGYKLSLDPLPVYKVPFASGIDEVKLSDSQYSYQHLKAFGLNNHLVQDPWHEDTVYYINQNWEIIKVEAQDGKKSATTIVFKIPDASNYRVAAGRLNVSMQIISPDWLVLTNGAGKLFFVNTGKRSENQPWKVTYADSVLGGNQYFVLIAANMRKVDSKQKVECILLHVDELADCCDKSSPFRTVLEWLSFSSDGDTVWTLERSRRLEGSTTPDYIAIEKLGTALYIASEKPFKFSFDSESPQDDLGTVDEGDAGGDGPKEPIYTWSQNSEEISVVIPVPTNTTKTDIAYNLSLDRIHLEVKNRDILLDGELHSKINVEGSTWLLSDDRLELVLTKIEPDTWPLLICGDTQGRAVLDAAQQQAVEDIAAITKTQETGPDGQLKEAYNSQELEECDSFPEDTAVMVRLDGETHKVTRQANISSHQWLFNATVGQESLPAICLRHDVDGILWQPKEDFNQKESPWQHIATFNALGYVQASKQNKKFATCGSDYSYSVLSDMTRHVYVYRQAHDISTPLRNRKTGRQVNTIAKQQVVSLETTDMILGLQASCKHIFVCTSHELYVIAI